MPKKQSQSKIEAYLEKLLDKILETPLEDMPRVGIYLYLTYISVVRFNSISMGWFGPFAMRLVEIPSYNEGLEVSFGIAGTSVKMPNAQQIGLAMLGFLGVLNILDVFSNFAGFPYLDPSLPMPKIDLNEKPPGITDQEYVRSEVLKQRYSTTLEQYLNFRRKVT